MFPSRFVINDFSPLADFLTLVHLTGGEGGGEGVRFSVPWRTLRAAGYGCCYYYILTTTIWSQRRSPT